MPGTGKTNRGPGAGPANRRALIAAAKEVFATAGYNAPLNAVAKRAGVGQGSLYRHFPTRTALAVAVFDENMTALEAVAADSGTTLDDLLDRVVEQTLVSTAFVDMLNADPLGDGAASLGRRLEAIVADVLARDQSAGRIGAHVAVADALLAIEMLADVLARTPPERRAPAASRARALFSTAFAAPAASSPASSVEP